MFAWLEGLLIKAGLKKSKPVPKPVDPRPYWQQGSGPKPYDEKSYLYMQRVLYGPIPDQEEFGDKD